MSVSNRVGVLLVQVGTPEAPTPRALKKYLKEFLSDPYVIDVPRMFWWPILHFLILPFRSKKSALAYQEIWTQKGSPLLATCRSLLEKIQDKNKNFIFGIGMGYGNPSLREGLQNLKQKGCEEIIVLPLFPQFSTATTASVLHGIEKNLTSFHFSEIKKIKNYHDHPLYIEALTKQIQNFWNKNGRPQKILISFHGLPQRFLVKRNDPYLEQCQKTTELLTKNLGLQEKDYQLCFQSRFGKGEWLQPYLDETLSSLTTQGFTDVHVVCPGFSIDCLETLHEVGIEMKKVFLEAGGKKFHYIPALNDSEDHVEMLERLLFDCQIF